MSKRGRTAWAGLFALALTGGAAAQDATIRFWNLWPENHDLWQEGGKVFADSRRWRRHDGTS